MADVEDEHSDGVSGLCLSDVISILNEQDHRGCSTWKMNSDGEVAGAILLSVFEATAIATAYVT
jgi:hypothetical protein